MELNTTYSINIISQIDKERGLFVVVERFNSGSTRYFHHYYEQLSLFNDCTEWFERFDYPIIESGKVVIVQDDKDPRVWKRGIISNCPNSNNLRPEVYLIDSQRFTDKDTMFELRTCPPKLLQLILPTYTIDINLCLDDDDLKTAITILIKKNQYGELSFSFTPQTVEDNVYSGELKLYFNEFYLPLKKLLKNVRTKKMFEDIPLYKKHIYSNFNPMKINYLKNIFIPREPSKMVFLDSSLVSSSCDLSFIDDSNTNSSYNSVNEFSSTTSNYSENICFSNDSEIKITKSQNNCITPIVKQKVYSSNNSLMNKSNSSLQSASSDNNNFTMAEIKQCNDFVVTRMSKFKKNTGRQQDNKSTLTLKVLETPKTHLNSISNIKPMNITMNDSLIWWSDDDDDDDKS